MGYSIKAVGKALAVVLGGFAAQFAHAEGSYYDLGSGITASGSSSNGSVVGAYSSLSGTFYSWTAAGGVQSIGGYWEGGVASVSGDGKLISGSATASNGNTQAATYNLSTGTWTTLGGIGGVSGTSESSGWNISGDGKTVVGLGWVNAGTAHAVQSTPAGTLTDLGSQGGSSRANAVSSDGSTIVGWSETTTGFWQGTYWKNGVMTTMVDASGNEMQEADAVSADGTWIVGAAPYSGLWRYNTTTGTTQSIGDLDPFSDIQGSTGISANGEIIVGYDRGFGPATFGAGFIWIDGLGMLNLTDYVTAEGTDLNGRTLALPMGISADGSTVYGMDNLGHGFVVTLAPVPEPASVAMLGLGLAGVLAASRRRRAAAQ